MLSLNAYDHLIHCQPCVTPLEPGVGVGMWVFLKNFPLQRLHFILHEAAQDFDLHLSAWLSVFCSASECVKHCSEFFLEFGGKGGKGMGLYLF